MIKYFEFIGRFIISIWLIQIGGFTLQASATSTPAYSTEDAVVQTMLAPDHTERGPIIPLPQSNHHQSAP